MKVQIIFDYPLNIIVQWLWVIILIQVFFILLYGCRNVVKKKGPFKSPEDEDETSELKQLK